MGRTQLSPHKDMSALGFMPLFVASNRACWSLLGGMGSLMGLGGDYEFHLVSVSSAVRL